MSVESGTSGRFFLDTNVFVYSFDLSASRKSQLAKKLIRQALLTRKGVISYQVVQEFFNVASRKFSEPLKPIELRQYLSTVLVPLLSVHWSPVLFSEALTLQQEHRLSWYDSLIVASAIQAQCNLLLSEDLQHGRKLGNLRIENPFV